MDTESLKSLGWLLIWGGLFYVMMRYGCGAHMMGGHGHNHDRHGTGGGGETRDPVCGMTISPQRAAAATVNDGETYYFCSKSCRDKFEEAPAQYVSGAPQGGRHCYQTLREALTDS